MDKMTSDLVENSIRFVTTVGGAVTGFVLFCNRFFKFKEIKLQENSVGATAIKQLVEADRKFTDDIKKLKEQYDESDEANQELRNKLDLLKKEHDNLVEKIWQYWFEDRK